MRSSQSVRAAAISASGLCALMNPAISLKNRDGPVVNIESSRIATSRVPAEPRTSTCPSDFEWLKYQILAMSLAFHVRQRYPVLMFATRSFRVSACSSMRCHAINQMTANNPLNITTPKTSCSSNGAVLESRLKPKCQTKSTQRLQARASR